MPKGETRPICRHSAAAELEFDINGLWVPVQYSPPEK